jgi:hypothetical protein
VKQISNTKPAALGKRRNKTIAFFERILFLAAEANTQSAASTTFGN